MHCKEHLRNIPSFLPLSSLPVSPDAIVRIAPYSAIPGSRASFIPVIRAIFPRPKEDEESANDTEYAFGKSKSLIRRILDSVQGRGGLASFAFFVFAVLYVFQNEVTLRVARTAGKRLKRLGAKIEEGQEDLTEKDLELLQGWRWRVLLWSS